MLTYVQGSRNEKNVSDGKEMSAEVFEAVHRPWEGGEVCLMGDRWAV